MRWVAWLLISAGAAFASAPERSLRPEARPISPEASQPVVSISDKRPRLRPNIAAEAVSEAVESAVVDAIISSVGLAVSLRPVPRPRAVERGATQAMAERARGQVCSDPDLQGERLAAIQGRLQGCGVASPVRVRSVAGVPLSTPSIMDCQTAEALKTWVTRGVKPAVGSQGGGVRNLRVAAHYVCRTRNHRPGARISEHGKGRAIDISGIGLRDGTEITLISDWGRGAEGRALREMWRAACGPFGTVLGPEADAAHRDHFHFDTARYRSGPYCR
ncbi:MAG: extensin family protein [Pseudomonadota bacterium]